MNNSAEQLRSSASLRAKKLEPATVTWHRPILSTNAMRPRDLYDVKGGQFRLSSCPVGASHSRFCEFGRATRAFVRHRRSVPGCMDLPSRSASTCPHSLLRCGMFRSSPPCCVRASALNVVEVPRRTKPGTRSPCCRQTEHLNRNTPCFC